MVGCGAKKEEGEMLTHYLFIENLMDISREGTVPPTLPYEMYTVTYEHMVWAKLDKNKTTLQQAHDFWGDRR